MFDVARGRRRRQRERLLAEWGQRVAIFTAPAGTRRGMAECLLPSDRKPAGARVRVHKVGSREECPAR